MSSTTAASSPAYRAAPGALALQPGRGRILDEVMMMLAFVILPLDFSAAQPLRVPFTLLLLVYIGWHWRSIAAVVLRGRWLFLLAAFCFLSVLWSADPAAAIRHGALMTLAMVVAVTAAVRLDPRQVVVAILLSQGALAVASVLTMTAVWIGSPSGGEMAVVGVFSHKNVLGQRMLFTLLAAVAVLLAPGYRLVWKPVALGVGAVALFLIAQSRSATAVLLAAGALPLGITVALVWGPAGGVRGLRPALLFGGVAALTLGLLILLNGFGIDPVGDLLAAFGKDTTLTGRTDVWAAAGHAFSENPLLGTGAGNFWRLDNSLAVQLAQRAQNDGADFRFHSFYVEVAVSLGLVGLLIALLVYGRGVLLVLTTYLAPGGARTDPFFLTLIAVFVLRSLTESELFYPMVLGPILFWIAVFSSVVARETARGPTALAPA